MKAQCRNSSSLSTVTNFHSMAPVYDEELTEISYENSTK